MPATKTDRLDAHARIIAIDIIVRARKASGPMWDRMSPDYRLTEARAILCCDMLREMEPRDHNLMVATHRVIIMELVPE